MQFNDLQAQWERLGSRIDNAIDRALLHGRFIVDPEVTEVEQRLAEHTGAEHVVSCANDSHALVFALRALGAGPGDWALAPAFTFAVSAEAVAFVGATPICVDVDEQTVNVSADTIRTALAAFAPAVRPIAVDLFGFQVPYAELPEVLDDRWLVADASQFMGAQSGDTMVGVLTDVTTISFFPAKPLGCYGDGGAVLARREDIAGAIRSLRVHGMGTHRCGNERIGYNSRLDTLQAAILIEKPAMLDDGKGRRRTVAEGCAAALDGMVAVPHVPIGEESAAQYTIRVHARDEVAAALGEHVIPFAVYYPRSLHVQTAYSGYPRAGELPASESVSRTVLSLPRASLPEVDRRRSHRQTGSVCGRGSDHVTGTEMVGASRAAP